MFIAFYNNGSALLVWIILGGKLCLEIAFVICCC